MSKLSRRLFNTSAIGALFWSSQADALLFSGVQGSIAPAGQITTLTLSNSGVSSETPIWSKTFGLFFPDSDVTGCPLSGGAATYPQFKSGSNVVAYSMSVNPAFWASGRLKHATFVLLLNGVVTIGSSSTSSITVNQTSNTSPPSASSRSLSDFNSADLKHTVVILDGVGSGTTYTSSLNSGVTTAASDNYVWLDGAAGKMWRIRQPYTNGGTPHGALHGYHYVMSMQNGAGGFGGIQYQFCISTPDYQASPTTLRDYYTFSTCQLFTSTTLIRDNVTSGRTNSYTFGWGGSGASANINPISGSWSFETGQTVRFTTTGTLPAGLSTNTTYQINTGNYYSPPYTTANVYDLSGNLVIMSSAGTGTHTVTAYPWLPYYGRIYACSTTGEWDYVQGGGSIAPLSGTVMTNCQVQFSNTYLRKSLGIPSYDFTPSVTTGTATPFYINTNCSLTNSPDAGGIDEHIGIMPTPFVRHVYTQSLTDERNVRAIGLCGGQINSNLRDSANGYTLPAFNNGHNGSGIPYSGMPNLAPTSRFSGSNPSSTFGQTNSNFALANICGYQYSDFSHRTQHFYYPYLITGQPEYMDMLIETANAPICGGFAPGTAVSRISTSVYGPHGTTASDGGSRGSRIVTTGATTRWGIYSLTDSSRQDAWDMAMTGCCAGIMPNNYPGMAGLWQYYNDSINDNINFINAVIALAPTSYASTNGLFYPQDTQYLQDSWQGSYNLEAWSMVHGLGVANCLGPINATINWYSHVTNTFGIVAMSLEEWNVRWLNGGSMPTDFTAPLIDADSKWGGYFGNDTGNPIFTWTSSSANFGVDTTNTIWVPTVNDMITFTTPPPPSQNTLVPAAFNSFQQYFIVSVGGSFPNYTFQLSAIKGGSAITNSDTNSGGCQAWVQTASPLNSFEDNAVTDYPTVNTRSMLMAISRGATMDATAKAALLAAIPPSSSSGFVTTPTYCFGQTL